jgi:hypothetical protein
MNEEKKYNFGKPPKHPNNPTAIVLKINKKLQKNPKITFLKLKKSKSFNNLNLQMNI